MANASRWSLSARQGFLVVGLLTAGLFVLCCGTGMTNIPVAVLGGAVALLGPAVILLSSARANRADVFGSAHVSQSSQPPATGIYGRADLHLVINAQGVRNAVVRLRDPQVPVSKWPDVGATLPVLIPNGNPRRAQVLWDQVRSHRDSAGRYRRYGDEEEDYYEYSPTPPAGVDLIDQVPDEDEVDEVPAEEVTVDPVSVDSPWQRPAGASGTPETAAPESPESAESLESSESQAPVPAGVGTATHAPASSTAPAASTAPVASAPVASAAPASAAPTSTAPASTAPVASAAPAAPAPAAPAGPLPKRRPRPWPRRQAEAGAPGANGAGGANGRAVGSPPVAASASATSTADEAPERSSPESPDTAAAAPAEAAIPEAAVSEVPAPDAATQEAATQEAAVIRGAEATPEATASTEAPPAAPPAEPERSTRPSVVPAQPTAAAVSAAEAAAAMVAEAEAQARAEAQAKPDTQAGTDTQARTDTQAKPDTQARADIQARADTQAKADAETVPQDKADAAKPAPAEATPPQETPPETPPEPETAQPETAQPEEPEATPPPSKRRAIELTITNPALATRTESDRGNGHATAEPYVASYLSDEPEDSQPGLGGVHNVSVTLIVADLRRSLTFYRDLLGLTEIDSGVGSAVLASGNARILLRQVTDTRPVDRRVVHLNLEVDDVHEAYERLRREGVEFMHPPRVVSQGEQLEQWAATLRDPDGHAIALTRWEGRWETRP